MHNKALNTIIVTAHAPWNKSGDNIERNKWYDKLFMLLEQYHRTGLNVLLFLDGNLQIQSADSNSHQLIMNDVDVQEKYNDFNKHNHYYIPSIDPAITNKFFLGTRTSCLIFANRIAIVDNCFIGTETF